MNETTLIPDWLTYRVAAAPDAPALISAAEQWSFAELDREATLWAQRLQTLGIGAGDRVAALLQNGIPYVTLVHALIKLRAVLVPLNTRLAAAELVWQIAHIRARLLLLDAPNAERAVDVHVTLPNLPCRTLTPCANWPTLDTVEPTAFDAPDRIDLAATHCIIHTSGTTGAPKGVMLTYGNHWWSAMGSALNLGTQRDDRWLALLPFFHIGGLAILMRGVIYGAPVVIHERFDPDATNQAIDTEHVTLVSVVANMLERMLDARCDQPFPPTLRAVLLGGGPAPRPLLERCATLGAPVVQTYGMTETASQAATLAPADALRKLGSAGKPLLPVELRIEQNGVACAPETVGEIVVRGPNVTAGYADQPEATTAAIRDGWLRTGDLGYLDAEGYLYVVDRRDDLIISGGENVYPAEIEAVLRQHPAVADAGVIGQADARWGQVPVAAVVQTPGEEINAAALIDFCATRLARYKTPRKIVFLDELPRNANGKLLRRKLRELRDEGTGNREQGTE
jgi:O-succinylbenzoic acid--CoA ligase